MNRSAFIILAASVLFWTGACQKPDSGGGKEQEEYTEYADLNGTSIESGVKSKLFFNNFQKS